MWYAENHPKLPMRIMGGLCLLIIGFEIYWGATQLIMGLATHKWLCTVAKITLAKEIRSLSLAYGRSGPEGIRPSYPKINYLYQVGENLYQGQRIQYGLLFNRPKIKERFPLDQLKLAYFNPSHPEQAVLMTGFSGIGFLYIVGLVLFFFCLAIIAWFFKP